MIFLLLITIITIIVFFGDLDIDYSKVYDAIDEVTTKVEKEGSKNYEI